MHLRCKITSFVHYFLTTSHDLVYTIPLCFSSLPPLLPTHISTHIQIYRTGSVQSDSSTVNSFPYVPYLPGISMDLFIPCRSCFQCSSFTRPYTLLVCPPVTSTSLLQPLRIPNNPPRTESTTHSTPLKPPNTRHPATLD